MPDYEHKSMAKPDEVRNPSNAKIELVNLGAGPVARATYMPGWRWSNDIKPIAKTDWCEVKHAGFVVSGRLGVRLASGSEFEVGPGDVVTLSAHHDGWVIGNEPCVMIDWGAIHDFAKG
jgi:hypothetical protein